MGASSDNVAGQGKTVPSRPLPATQLAPRPPPKGCSLLKRLHPVTFPIPPALSAWVYEDKLVLQCTVTHLSKSDAVARLVPNDPHRLRCPSNPQL